MKTRIYVAAGLLSASSAVVALGAPLKFFRMRWGF